MANDVAATSSPGEWLSCSEDKVVGLVDWRTGSVLQRWRGHERGVNCVHAVPRVGAALSSSRDTTVRMWKRGQAEAVATLRGHELTVSAIACAEDGTQALSGSRDSSLRIWDLETSSCSTQCHVSRNVVTCARWIPGEAALVAQGSEDLRLRLWDIRTLSKPAATLEGYVYFPLCCDCSGPYVLTGSNGFNSVGCELRLWDRRALRQVHQMEGHEQAVLGACLLPSNTHRGRLLAASGCKEGEVRLWDIASGQPAGGRCKLPSGGVTGVAAACAEEEEAALFVSSTLGAVHALSVDAEGTCMRVVATGGGEPA